MTVKRVTLFSIIIMLCAFTTRAQSFDIPCDTLVRKALEAKGVVFSDNNKITLLMSGQEKFDDMFTAIRQAKSSIHLEYFNFRNDSIASLLFDILAKKAKEGVEVRAIFDAFGNASNNRPLKEKHIKDLRSKGIDIQKFGPLRFPWINYAFSRDHRKIVTIDGKVAYTGGMNVADYYIHGTEQVGEWRDMHCRIEGDAVNELQKIFLKAWNKTTKESVQEKKYFQGGMPADMVNLKPDTTSTTGEKLVGIANREPHTSNEIIRIFYNSVINNAKDSIKIINPYFTLTKSINKSLKRALRRGVKVEIMVSEKSDIPLTPDVVYHRVRKLMKRGAIVWVYRNGFHHTKVIMADGKVCTVGSANLNSRSLRWDYEANAVILDSATTRELDTLFEQDKHNSFLLTDETWKSMRTPWQKFKGWFGALLSPFI